MMKGLSILMGLHLVAAIYNPVDPSSYANVHEVRTTHQHLDFLVDLQNKRFVGMTTHTMDIVKPGVESAFFDIIGIDVQSANIKGSTGDFTPTQISVTTPRPAIGSALEVKIPLNLRNEKSVQIQIIYNTNSKQVSTSWMTKDQTACHTMEYLYTKCEMISCRSIAPMQDTPQNRITYSAHITVPKGFDVRMSANRTRITKGVSTNIFEFENQISIPSYLIAMAVGDLAYKALDYRTGVITEPCRLDAVAWELEQLPTFLNYAEDYLTPYIWGSYAVLVLPPSFPSGGMENPLLTFASPTIITGDRSQVSVAIHEIAHSWTGNQVTLKNWSNMWMNEGFTVYEERKVSARIFGENFSKVNAFIGNISMYEDMQGYGLKSNFSSLYPIIDGSFSPDETFSEIPYEKGYQLLAYIETLIGSQLMNQLLRNHVYKNSLKSINYTKFASEFEEIVRANFLLPDRILNKMDWDAWVKQPGLAPVTLDFTTPELIESRNLADAYITLGGHGSPEKASNFKTYFSNLKVIFLNQLMSRLSQVTIDIMTQIDKDLDITHIKDPECLQRWLPMSILKNYQPAIPVAHNFVATVGRKKYIIPLYKALVDSNQ